MKKKVGLIEKKCFHKMRWKRILCRPGSSLGICIIVLFFLLSIFAPWIAPNNPEQVNVLQKLAGPSKMFPFGTDQLGRCILSRLIWGGRYSLFYSVFVMSVTVLAGVPIGMISGYIGGKTDQFIMRVVDLFLAMPSFIIALAIAGTLGASGRHLVLAMSCVYWAGYARIARGLTLQMKGQEYVMALRGGGCRRRRIIFKHILPNIASPVIALAAMEFGSVILAIAGFSFIGLGVQPPAPEWGIMLSDSRNYIQTAPQLMIYPGITIVIIVMAFNMLGDGIKNGISGDER